MTSLRALAMAACAAAALVSLVAHAQPAMKLTAQDYIDIKQLSSRYAFAIEHCTNKGYDYASLYTKDGAFGSSLAWDTEPTKWSSGPDALATAAGGGPGGCKPPKEFQVYGMTHAILGLEITPTPTGAKGRAILLVLGVGTPTTVERQGGYQDTYVKTPQGWRFKTRIHVFPNRATSKQFGPGAVQYQGVDFR